MVILGASPPDEIADIDQKLRSNAELFGHSTEKALGVRISDTDRNLEFAVIDGSHRLRFAYGGIPVKANVADVERVSDTKEVLWQGTSYASLQLSRPGPRASRFVPLTPSSRNSSTTSTPAVLA
jgi:hypothetical protein